MKKILLLTFLIPLINFSQTQIGQDIIGEDPVSMAGNSVDISIDGNIIAIGAPGNDGNGNDSGHVRLYENVNGVWTQIGNDIDGEASNNQSGLSLSLSDNGSIVAVGAHRNTTDNNGIGHVRVFENINDVWTQIGNDIDATPNSNERLGKRVSLSSDGSILAALAHNDFNHFVRVFKFLNGSWVQIGQDIFGGYEQDNFGHYISLSSDGSTIAIGNRNASTGLNKGRVRVYQNINDVWTQIGQDLEGVMDGDYFGISVTLNSDANIIGIGARFSDVNGLDSGQVKVYENINNTWTQIGQSINGDAAEDSFGSSLSLSTDGSILAIGAPNNDAGGGFSGQIKIYQYNGSNWIQRGVDIIGNVSDQLGISIGLSADGSKLVGGAYTASPNISSGLTRVYDLSAILSTDELIISHFNLYPNPTKNQFTIQLGNPSDLQDVTIYNNLGQQVLNTKETIVDTSKLASGPYIVEIETTKGKGVQRLIIE